jgi:hypothetical protein
MSRTSSLLLAGAVLAAALAPAAVAGAAPQGKADKAKAEHERIVAYWTPERMKAAQPRDFEKLPDGSFRQVKPTKGANGNRGGKPGGGGTTTSSVTGATYTGDGQVTARTGRVYFEMGGGAWVCSGSVAEDGGVTGAAVVLSAGHCVVDETTGEFATYWMFVPDFDEQKTWDCNAARFGCWTARALVAHSKFANAGGFTAEATRYDFAFAVVSGDLDNVVGAYPVTTSVSNGNTMSAFGYPAAGKYHGDVLTYCSGPITQDSRNANATWGLACDMTGGSSGGPWLKGVTLASGSGGTLGSLNSYGYSGKSFMYGPKFNASTTAVYSAAKAAAKAGTLGGIPVTG